MQDRQFFASCAFSKKNLDLILFQLKQYYVDRFGKDTFKGPNKSCNKVYEKKNALNGDQVLVIFTFHLNGLNIINITNKSELKQSLLLDYFHYSSLFRAYLNWKLKKALLFIFVYLFLHFWQNFMHKDYIKIVQSLMQHSA